MWLKLGGWVELGSTKFYEVIFDFWQVLNDRSSLHEGFFLFFVFFRRGRLHVAQTQWVGELQNRDHYKILVS